ncbi:MAG TPA: hypothetical protein PKC13_14120 [Blastocatellia bacterium]|nr:hypothetical protein [Blastocatellia bacterium]HMY72035.1 hypothetical protein [Blastocatellia bacterium]
MRMVKFFFWLLVLLIPLALWAGVAAILRRKLSELYRCHFSDPRRERLFLPAVSFFHRLRDRTCGGLRRAS